MLSYHPPHDFIVAFCSNIFLYMYFPTYFLFNHVNFPCDLLPLTTWFYCYLFIFCQYIYFVLYYLSSSNGLLSAGLLSLTCWLPLDIYWLHLHKTSLYILGLYLQFCHPCNHLYDFKFIIAIHVILSLPSIPCCSNLITLR